MNTRPDTSKTDRSLSQSRKNKKKTSKKINQRLENNWCVSNPEEEEEEEGGAMPNGAVGMEYGEMFWQQQPSGIPPHMQPHTGQRLFTAMSDPSVCGYSAVPMAYTMEPVSMPPIYPLYRPVPQPQQGYTRPFRRRNVSRIHHHHQPVAAVNQGQMMMGNGYSSLQENRSNYLSPRLYENGDYASLPPSANNDTGDDGGDELNSEHRRYSDPGLGPADIKSSEESDSGESESSIITIGKNNKLVLSLVEQMTSLKEANSRMFKELHETKLSLDSVKAELARVKSQTSSDYQPGMLSDIISEMREASRILDESMMTKVTAIVEDKNHQRRRELEEVKDRLAKLTEDKEEDSRRIVKLEEEIARFKINSNNEDREIAAFEEETLALRRELQEARSSRQSSSLSSSNNGLKCVEEKSTTNKRITPVIFKSPCVTSTPLRKDKNDNHESSCHESIDSLTSSLSSAPSLPSSSSSSASSVSSTASSPIPLLSSSNSSRNVQDNYGVVVDSNWQWQDLEHGSAQEYDHEEEEEEDEEKKKNTNSDKESIKSDDDKNNHQKVMERLIKYNLEREDNIIAEKPMIKNKLSSNKFKSEGKKEISKKQQNGFSLTSSASSSESDAADKIINNKNNNLNITKVRRKRGIVDVPDVVFIAGKTVVSNDLHSTRFPPTSTVPTAYSRATYTTAFI